MQQINRTVGRIAVAVVIACGVLAGPVLPAAEAAGYRVAVADLDLATRAGMDALAVRVRFAAASACGYPEARGYARRQQARRCVDATVAATLAEVRRARPAANLLAAN